MELKPETQRALNSWIGSGTWHTSHPLDSQRFNKFVDTYEREHGTSIDESDLQEAAMRIHEKRKGEAMSEGLQSTLRRKISLMYDILDFLKDTGRQSLEGEGDSDDF